MTSRRKHVETHEDQAVGAGAEAPLPSPSAPPSDPKRHAREVDLARMLKPGYWRRICPQLHVSDASYQRTVAPLPAAEDVAADARERVLRDGFTKIPAACLRWKSVKSRDLALGVVQLMQHGWNPSFLLMFDEAWAVAHELVGRPRGATDRSPGWEKRLSIAPDER